MTGNGGDLTVELPMFKYAYNLKIANATAIKLPALQSSSENLDISYNSTQNLSMLESAFVGGDFMADKNPNLSELYMNDLVSVGGSMDVSNNTQITDLSRMLSLSSIGAAMTLIRSFARYVSVDL